MQGASMSFLLHSCGNILIVTACCSEGHGGGEGGGAGSGDLEGPEGEGAVRGENASGGRGLGGGVGGRGRSDEASEDLSLVPAIPSRRSLPRGDRGGLLGKVPLVAEERVNSDGGNTPASVADGHAVLVVGAGRECGGGGAAGVVESISGDGGGVEVHN